MNNLVRALAAAAAVIVLATAGRMAYSRWFDVPPARLIAQAYAQQRPFDFRVPGAEHSPVRAAKRGPASSFDRPRALLEVEALIARELEKHPDSADWLTLRARAEMLANDAENAIATLTRALDQRPNDPALMADLGMAYALRADTQNRVIDLSAAIEHLTQALRANPDFADAIFNRSLVFERLYMYHDAIREWERYLSLDARGGWAGEARHRLAALMQKQEVRKTARARISPDPARFLERLKSGEKVEPEPYLDIVIIDWLPRRWDDPRIEEALNSLAGLFQTRHRDPWLRDVLSSGKNDALVRGFAALSAALKANRANRAETALASAGQAAAMLGSAGSAAGALRAKVEQAYALRRAVRARDCVAQALAAEREARARNHLWILGQIVIELGTCRGMTGDRGGAEREMLRAVDVSRQASYPSLELRATSILAGTQTGAGNLLIAWGQARDGLSKFWSGPFSGVRAQQIYYNLARAAESVGRLQAAYLFGRASAEATVETPDRLGEGTIRYLAANMAQLAGWPGDASAEYQRAAVILGRLEQTKPVREMRLFADLRRAETETAVGAVDAALRRLDGVREQVHEGEYEVARMRYYRVVGDARRRAGEPDQAEAAYEAAIDLSRRRLDSFQDFQQRSASIEAIGDAYRGLAELRWARDGDPARALRVWEAFRAGEWPRGGTGLDLARRLGALRRETFISYAVLPGGIVTWVFDDRGIESVRLSVRPEQLERTVKRFLRLCADPASGQAALRRDGRQLYEWLVAPVARRLDAGRVLVVEPDGPVGAIPMQALIDGDSRYLGERFAIVIARGLVDYQHRSEAARVTASSRTLVVANPALDSQTARAFPPLSQTAREAGRVAARFPQPVVLAGKEATLAALDLHRPRTEVFHFAGHGFSNAGNGGLLLAPGAGAAMGASVLDGKWLAGQDWRRCRLAVLSACSSGTGETSGPVNPESLVRRLLWAGVARIVASRWNADSETGVRLMEEFYSHLLDGHDVSAALRQSAQSLRQAPASNHPYYWAGFQSFGSR